MLRQLAEPRSCTGVAVKLDQTPQRRYHELPQWRSIWRQIEIAGVPEGMFSIDQ